MNTDIKMISKDLIRTEAEEKVRKGIIPTRDEMVNFVVPSMKLDADNSDKFDIAERAERISNAILTRLDDIKMYGSAFDLPQPCMTLSAKDGKKDIVMSVREMINSGVFMSSNSLPTDWQTLWDALRIDISIRKAALGTVRENFFNIMNMPNSDKIFKATEFYPYGIVFEENNGEGQAVTQGETRGGQVESIENIIYAAGFTYTLLADLFSGSVDPQKISDAVMLGYNAKQDDLSINPILAYSYSGTQQTAPSTVGTLRQELLYTTLENAIDDLADREDPVTGRKIMADNLVILAHPEDARHISRVVNGLPSVNERSYPSISEISKIVAYDGEDIVLRAKTISYTGVTKGKSYLVKKNRYMNIGIKRGLTLEVDRTPDVKTLSREERAWYFVEGQQTTGIASFIQEITLPTW